jgi:hypothetical protein
MSSKIVLTDESKVKSREIILKSLNDASFKERLLNNPKEAVEELYPGYTTRDARKIVICDQTDKDTIFLNVSHLQYALLDGDQDLIELSQEDLDQVAGGVQEEMAMSCSAFSC